MKALLLLCIMVIAVPASFLNPFVGIATYIWMAIARPHEWAYVRETQYSLMVGLATILGYVVFDAAKRPPRIIPNTLMILIWFQCLLGTYFGVNVANGEPKFIEFTKLIVIGILISSLVDSASRVRWLLMVSVGSIGLLSFRSFVAIVVRMGNVKIVGPGGTLEDNNDYALLLVMAVPLMFYLAKSETGRWLKLAFYAQCVMTLTTVLFSMSRGGFLGLCVASVIMALKSKHKTIGIATIAIAGILFLNFGPDKVKDRLSTIQNATEQDTSAQQRLRAWGVSLDIIKDYPLTGIGMKNILLVYGKYGDPLDARVTHNSYLQCAVDAGIPALLFFLLMIALSFLRLRKIRKVLQNRAPDSFMIQYTHGLEASLAGYCVSAFFLSQYAQEFLYVIVPIVTSMRLITKSMEKEGEMQDMVEAAATKAQVPNQLGNPVYGVQ